MSEQKTRVRELYQFLREANQLRFPPVRNYEDHPAHLFINSFPEHPCVQVFRPVKGVEDPDIPDTLISVQRPVLTKCPPPPGILLEWLQSGWDNPAKTESYIESINRTNGDGETYTEHIADDRERIIAATDWSATREAWAKPERIALRAMGVFQKFYELFSSIEKDGEQLELILADGHMGWETSSEKEQQITINHPVLLKRVELLFDPNKPEFTIRETDRESELYSGIFIDLKEVAAGSIKKRQDELAVTGYHPFGWEDTEAFLNAFILTVSPLKGEYVAEPCKPSKVPRLWRSPLLILRKRVSGLANAIDRIIDDIDVHKIFPPALGQITGTSEGSGETFGSGGFGGGDTSPAPEPGFASDDHDILLAKPSNNEQTQIIKRLQRSGSVLVQGPPGTGKTHTIGNIIGHLLSQGKSVLVTSHTTKALRVLRDKVPEELQPLCVSVLGSDADARTQLESSIRSITERLTRGSGGDLLAAAQRLSEDRTKLLSKTTEIGHQLRKALENEYREVVFCGKEFTPSDAARHVAKHREEHGWMPAPVKPGAALNLGLDELTRLYALGGSFTPEEEQDALLPLPDLAELPAERQFEFMVDDYVGLTTTDLSHGKEKWNDVSGSSEQIAKLSHLLSIEFSDELRSQQWRPHAIVAGMHGGSAREVWEKIISKIEGACEASAQHSLVLHHKAGLSDAFTVVRQQQLASEICMHLESGGKLGMLQLLTKQEWRKYINSVTVAAGRPDHKDHFDALLKRAHLEIARNEIESLWDLLIGQATGETFSKLGMSPELACRAVIPEMKRCLEWHAKSWLPLVEKLKTAGLKLDDLIASLPREASPAAEYLAIEKLAVTILPGLLEKEAARRRLQECEAGFKTLEDLSARMDGGSPNRGSIGRIVSALRSRNKSAYADALSYARRLYSVKPLVEERNHLIEKLRMIAPGWAEQIASRIPPHDGTTVIGDVEKAWLWRQLHDELAERDKLNAQNLQQELEKCKVRLREITVDLIDARAWGNQIGRLQSSTAVRQALVGWLDTTKRLASTRQAERKQALLSEARKLMKQCAQAVPVWVMPISLMAEAFDPRTTKFDVVIIDEASQADLNALIPLYMANQVIIVGDNEQVTPLGVGKDQTALHNLRKAILQKIPNSHLYDSLSSIYDIARQSFGDAIRLTEHFRCVPEIIAYSNMLSYEGSIRPLRETSSSDLKPACIPYHVNGVREANVNRVEAETIVSLIEAMIKHPAYDDKTIGVISMIGEHQAFQIESMLHRRIDSVELLKRRIQAGVSAQFQGDERDVILLSFVDSQGEGEGFLRAMGDGAFEQTKKRFNVATSRARDQLWAVYSFDPDRHLKADDIRLKLLQHMQNPWSTIDAYAKEAAKTDSDFERQVLKRLAAAGYRVKSQWQVGYYRIDLVVEGAGKRLAIECDGDRYHPIEKLQDDIARQAVLERLGWQFVRIRGSEFYRYPDEAMSRIFEQLETLGIPPEGPAEEKQDQDLTLVYELESIITGENDTEQEPGGSETGEEEECRPQEEPEKTTEPKEEMPSRAPVTKSSRVNYVVRQAPVAPKDLDSQSPLVDILNSLGKKATIERLLRRWALVRGHERIGKNIKLAFENEFEACKRRGDIEIVGEDVVLQFPKPEEANSASASLFD